MSNADVRGFIMMRKSIGWIMEHGTFIIVKKQQVSLNWINKVLSNKTCGAAFTLGQDCCTISLSTQCM